MVIRFSSFSIASSILIVFGGRQFCEVVRVTGLVNPPQAAAIGPSATFFSTRRLCTEPGLVQVSISWRTASVSPLWPAREPKLPAWRKSAWLTSSRLSAMSWSLALAWNRLRMDERSSATSQGISGMVAGSALDASPSQAQTNPCFASIG